MGWSERYSSTIEAGACLFAVLSASACVPVQDQFEVSGIPGACSADAVQRLIGRERSARTGEEALRLSGAVQLRWIAPGDPVSMDYSTDRINIEMDGRRVTRIYCG